MSQNNVCGFARPPGNNARPHMAWGGFGTERISSAVSSTSLGSSEQSDRRRNTLNRGSPNAVGDQLLQAGCGQLNDVSWNSFMPGPLPSGTSSSSRTTSEVGTTSDGRGSGGSSGGPRTRSTHTPSESDSTPSKGSANHDAGLCKPCAFTHTRPGCVHGTGCEFCHRLHRSKDKPRPCKSKRERYRQLTASKEGKLQEDQLALSSLAGSAATQDSDLPEPWDDPQIPMPMTHLPLPIGSLVQGQAPPCQGSPLQMHMQHEAPSFLAGSVATQYAELPEPWDDPQVPIPMTHLPLPISPVVPGPAPPCQGILFQMYNEQVSPSSLSGFVATRDFESRELWANPQANPQVPTPVAHFPVRHCQSLPGPATPGQILQLQASPGAAPRSQHLGLLPQTGWAEPPAQRQSAPHPPSEDQNVMLYMIVPVAYGTLASWFGGGGSSQVGQGTLEGQYHPLQTTSPRHSNLSTGHSMAAAPPSACESEDTFFM